ncbi:MAG: HYR domain-containing protein [Saprospiraceae bacterium]|nr:HYR domain-containing protein [Saprospiraceae bacterium]
MKKAVLAPRFLKGIVPILAFLASPFISPHLQAQCVAPSGVIQGSVFRDDNNNGKREQGEPAESNVLVSLYNTSGQLVANQASDASGNYSFGGLTDGAKYRLGFDYLPKFTNSYLGADNKSNVQLVSAPACNASLGLVTSHAVCGSNPEIFSTCFVQGATNGANGSMETLLGIEYNFNNSSQATKYAMHSETGSVWGLAWKSSTNELFSSAFVKQYSGLTSNGPGAIFKTKINGNASAGTQLFANLSNLGIDVGTPAVTDVTDCKYGTYVGKLGLGAMAISPAEDYLYVVNLYRKSIVRIPTQNPTAANTVEISIPNPGCSNGEYAPFALKYHNDKLYVGVTCYEETNKSAANSAAVVYELDLSTQNFTNIFSTTYLKGYWKDEPYSDFTTQHWFTDLDFTDDGNMIITFTDRVGHKYCNQPSNRLDHQFPDILMVWNNNGVWTLESNGTAGSLTGTGVGNTQGPDGGEFFGNDYWVTQPAYHPEIALGSIYVLPGTGSVVTAAYDPGTNSYSGGMQRYSTTNGSKLGAKELYIRQTTELFGKATGFGDLIGRCGLPSIQLGNLVWFDENKNGIQDAGEQPVANLPLQLLDENCDMIASTTTSAEGQYVFSDLQAGKQYYISIPAPAMDVNYQLVSLSGSNYLFSPATGSQVAIDNNAGFNNLNCSNAIIAVSHDKTNHNVDIGLVTVSGFDLALKNELISSELPRYNDLVEFRMTVYNQGGVPAKDIQVVNYIPSGYTFNAADNPGWTLDGTTAKIKLPGTLLPGSNNSVVIKLRIITSDLSKLVNVAEIASATDHNGIAQTDVDSTPDAMKSNDEGGDVNTFTDNKIDDDGTIDEDDQDPATARVLDLALKQVVQDECVLGGDCVTVNVTVYNQGTVGVTGFEVTNYFHPLMKFDEGQNPSWAKSGDYLVYQGEALQPGGQLTVPVTLCVKEGVLTEGIVNFAEISTILVNGLSTENDFDSRPDSNDANDAGGTHNSAQDNYILGVEGVEEDDHDPVYLGVRYVDMALILTTETRKVKEGDLVCFDITIYNQGSQSVKEVNVVDYVPYGLKLNTQGWTEINSTTISKTLTFENGLAPGTSYVENVCFNVGDIKGVYAIENVAEINGAIDICGNDVTSKDIDSKADHIKSNDMGGHPQTDTDNIVNGLPSIDEDDHDPALLINYEVTASACDCLHNATNAVNGQYEQIITVRGPQGMTWYIDQVVNLFSDTSLDPPAAPIPFITGTAGYTLTESVVNATTSDYTFSAIYEDGKNWSVVLKSTEEDFELIKGLGCGYDPIEIAGTASLCTNSQQVYSVPSNVSGYHVSLAGGGNIIASSADSSSVTVQWGAAPGTYALIFSNKNPFACDEPGILNVAVGNPDLAMACKGQIQVSLDGDCYVEITPAMVVAGNLNPSAPYQIMLMDDKGQLMPGNAITADHAGKTVIAKMIEGCSGNSCWSTLKIEDKTPPVMVCNDTVEVSCYKADTYPGPLAYDNCGGAVSIVVLDSITKPLYCDRDYNMYIDKTYQAIDKYGNKSSICKQTIAVKRLQVNEIIFPKDIEMVNALTCNNFDVDEFGMPSPSETGVPTLEGWPIYPNFAAACNMGVDYRDRDFGYIGCARKIMRIWTVYEAWCTSGVIRQDTQTIIIADLEAPSFTCPQNITVSAGHGQCEGFAQFPALTGMTDDCSTKLTVDIKYPGGFIDNYNGGSAYLPVGVHAVKYLVYDECLNVDSCTFYVTVEDKTPPVVVCDHTTTVGLNSLGQAYIYAETIDDGSYDACGMDYMEIRRMDAGVPCGNHHGFRDIASFCCADVGKEVMVELRVWDLAGNSNSCMVGVQVQDKTAPTIFCPPNDTISCEVDYDINNLTAYGVATAQDACGVTIREVARANVDQCRVGSIERVFTASDGNGTARCTSYIYIQKPTNDLNIVWPLDYATTNGCTPSDLDPNNLPLAYSKPRFNDGVCDLVASSKDDQYFPFDDGQGSCFKIVRTWTVIDWCRKDEPGYTPAVHQQLIKVSNTVAPEIFIDSDDEACTDETSCDEGYITLVAEGADDCTPDESLFWSYAIDYDFDGSFTADVTDQGKGSEIDASGFYQVGNHRIIFTFEDRCGNQISEFHDFEIKNCKAPIASCINGTSISLQPMTINGQNVRMACITAASLNVSSSHPCNYPFSFAFSTDVTDTTKCFDCTDLGRVNISLYVIDIFGNYSVCETFIDVQNNSGSTIQINATDEEICNGQSTTLTVTGSTGAVIWNTGATGTSITVSPATTATFTVSVTSEDGCTLSASKTIIVDPKPVATINVTAGSATICAGKTATLTATGGGTYTWSTGANTASINVSPTTTTTYTVTVTSALGCTATATSTVTVNPLPNAAIAAVNPICVGQSATLTASGGGTYLWSTNATTAAITVTPAVTTTYTVTVTSAAGCTATASRIVTVNPLPTVTINTVNPICVGQSATLTATGTGSYTWSTGATSASITVSPTTTTTYTVTVTSTAGCTATASRIVTVNPLPAAAIANVAPICAGQSATLTASGGGTYLWSTNATTASITVSPASTTSYTVTVTSAAACTATATATVTVNPLPAAVIAGVNAICVGQSTQLTASGGTSFNWNTTPAQTTAAITVAPVATTTYVVTVTNANGCTDTESKILTVNPLPVAAISGDLSICLGESTTLTATGGVAYVWNTTPVQTTAAITVSPTANTTYTVTVTNANGCTDTESVIVNVSTNNQPVALCKNVTVYLDATGAVILSAAAVNNGSSAGCDNLPITLAVSPNQFFCNDINLSPLTVTLTVTSSNGTSSTCTAQVSVLDTLPPVITCPSNLTFNCATFNGIGNLPGATATDNCPPAGITSVVLNATNSCSIGTITRSFTATDASGNSSECTQLITITGPTDPLTANDITFPADITVNSCTTINPSVTGNVVVNTAAASCVNPSVSFVDVNLNPNVPCNFTIQRTWTVIDSCTLNVSTGAGIFTDIQLILVNDNQPPVIAGYTDITISADSCPANVIYPMQGVTITDCSPVVVTNNSPFANNNNSGNPSGFYDEGTTQVIITATDACGNEAKDTISITVTLTGPAAVFCEKIVRNINDQEFVDVKAEEFVTAITGTCNPDSFAFSYTRTNVNDTIQRFFCDDLGDIFVWVYWFENGVNFDSCKSILTVLDPDSFCTGNIFRVFGYVLTENSVPVEGVNMNLGGMGSVSTNNTGAYRFENMESAGNYMLKPEKNDGLLEGVSTLDIIMIQRHILGSSKIISPYRLVAADVNNDDRISASDLVELKKAILGTSLSFKNNTSWKMIDSKYSFPDPNNPFNDEYPLYHEFTTPRGSMLSDFVGVKVGDVNTSYTANANTSAENRSNLKLTANDSYTESGEDFNLAFVLNGVVDFDGGQFIFDVSNLTDIEVNSNIFASNDLNYHVNNGKLTILISLDQAVTLKDQIIFEISGKTNSSGLISDHMKMNSSTSRNEIYTNMVPRSIGLDWNAIQNGFSVKQNAPNPWTEKTSIVCQVDKAGTADIKLMNATGALLYQTQQKMVTGENHIEIKADMLDGFTGVILYEIQLGSKIANGKMIRIK